MRLGSVAVTAVVVIDTAPRSSLPAIPRRPTPAPNTPAAPVDPTIAVAVALRWAGHIGVEVRPRASTCDIDIDSRIPWRGGIVHLNSELMLVVVVTVPMATPALTVMADTMGHEQLPIVDHP